jgi:hypothetical protein
VEYHDRKDTKRVESREKELIEQKKDNNPDTVAISRLSLGDDMHRSVREIVKSGRSRSFEVQ